MAKYRITEEQYNMALEEGIDVSVNPKDANGNLTTAFKMAKENVRKSGAKPQDVTYTIKEDQIITKKKLKENRVKKLKENSILYNVKDIISFN